MLMRCLAETFQQIDTGNGVPWKDRVLLCYYTVRINLYVSSAQLLIFPRQNSSPSVTPIFPASLSQT